MYKLNLSTEELKRRPVEVAVRDTDLEPEKIRELCDRLEQLRRENKKPPCYLEEQTNSAYPLCVGRGFKNCAHCGFWRDLDEEQDERRVNTPLALEELREMDGEPVYLDLGAGGEWVLVRAPHGKVFITHKNSICAPARIALECGAKIYRRKPEEGTL